MNETAPVPLTEALARMALAHPTRTATKFAHKGPVLRLHAGLESADDLIADLDAGLKRLRDAA